MKVIFKEIKEFKILWYFLPVFSLILFLIVSIFHFGCGDLNWKNNNLYYKLEFLSILSYLIVYLSNTL